MSNQAIQCDVCECCHNDSTSKHCTLNCISVTHQATGADAVATPHYCKSFTTKA